MDKIDIKGDFKTKYIFNYSLDLLEINEKNKK